MFFTGEVGWSGEASQSQVLKDKKDTIMRRVEGGVL